MYTWDRQKYRANKSDSWVKMGVDLDNYRIELNNLTEQLKTNQSLELVKRKNVVIAQIKQLEKNIENTQKMCKADHQKSLCQKCGKKCNQ